MMLVELYLLQTYFEEPVALMFEDDLVRRFGHMAVSEALENGLLERRLVPCSLKNTGGHVRCICRLSPTGHIMARQSLGTATNAIH